MSSIFCCGAIRPYRPQHLSHESKFTSFEAWAAFPRESRVGNVNGVDAPFAIQLVRQVNFGPLESKRYFIPREGERDVFQEVGEDDLVQANFQKLNTYVYPRACSAQVLTMGEQVQEPQVRDSQQVL